MTLNPFTYLFGRRSTEATRQQFDPGPIRQRSKAILGGEWLGRHLRMKGRLIAHERTVIPSCWERSPDAFRQWKHELAVGSRLEK